MLKQIKILTACQLRALFGINEALYTKDTSKKRRLLLLLFVWLLVGTMMIFYIGIMSHGLASVGLSALIPVFLFAITSMMILVFGMLKAGSVIFQMKTYEMVISLPVKKAAVIISRFLTMYVSNLLISALLLIPGLAVYAYSVKPNALFYGFALIGLLFLPLLPMTLATLFGAAITAIGARMRHKSLITSALLLLVTAGLVLLSAKSASMDALMTEEALQNLAEAMKEQLGTFYPPAVWFGESLTEGSLMKLLLLIGSYTVLFLVMIFLVQLRFTQICAALNATHAKGGYRIKALKSTSPTFALYRRELKQYASSSLYLVNTIIGPILLAAAGIALFFLGDEALANIIPIPGYSTLALPFMLAAIGGLMPTTASSVSMEGKYWWLIRSLPVSTKAILNAKLLVNLSILVPCYVVAEVFTLLAMRPEPLEALWLLLFPALHCLLCTVLGLTFNLLFPVLHWENEATVIKQSAAAMLTMLFMLLPIGLMLLPQLLPDINFNLLMTGYCAIYALAIVILYTCNNRTDLKRIN